MTNWRNIVLIVLLSALAFGGSFTCKGSTHDEDKNEDDTNNPPPPALIMPFYYTLI